jgi:hypothetical protein
VEALVMAVLVISRPPVVARLVPLTAVPEMVVPEMAPVDVTDPAWTRPDAARVVVVI